MKLLIFTSLIFLINYFLKKKNYLSNNTGQLHQNYSEKILYLFGGIFLIIFFSYDLFRNESLLLISLYILFIIGILADLDLIRSPSKELYYKSSLLYFL